MLTMNKVDLLDCAAGHHDPSDDECTCRVCGYSEPEVGIPAAPTVIWLVEGEHFSMPGLHRSAHATEAGAKIEAMRLVNDLRTWLHDEEDDDGNKIDLSPITDPDKWEQAMEEARSVQAKKWLCDPDDLDDDDGYVIIVRLEVEGAQPDPVRDAAPDMLAALIDLLKPGSVNGAIIEAGRDLLARLGHDVRPA